MARREGRSPPLLPVLLACMAMLPVSGWAAVQQQVYPANGQQPAQQAQDEQECSAWAVGKSGYDPANPPQKAVAQPAPVTGSGARVRGATAGAAVGAIGGNDVGDAAVKGAVAGAVVKRNRNRAAAAQANHDADEARKAGELSFANARQACLEGRGYTVK